MCIKIKRILVCICCTMKMIHKLNNQNENGSKFAKQVGNNNHLGLLLGEYKGKKLKTLGWKKPKAKNTPVKKASKSQPLLVKGNPLYLKSLYWPTHSFTCFCGSVRAIQQEPFLLLHNKQKQKVLQKRSLLALTILLQLPLWCTSSSTQWSKIRW